MGWIKILFGNVEKKPPQTSIVPTNKDIDNSTRFNFPPRTKNLLLLTKQSPEEYMYDKNTICIADLILTIRTMFLQNVEPSVISSTLPINKPRNTYQVEPLPYWPRYDTMLPEQRWIYLNWLTDITQPVDIGYVFVYYYGLERHLIAGNFEDAVEEIFLLQQYHHHNSFLTYSSNALVLAMYIRGDYSFLERLTSNDHLCEHINPDILFLMKADKGIELTAKELMRFARKIGFTNTRYIKKYPDLFEKHLNEMLVEYRNINNHDIIDNGWQKSPIVNTVMFANMSLGDQRCQKIPCITQNPMFSNKARELLQKAHNNVKSEIKKYKDTSSIKTNEVTTNKVSHKSRGDLSNAQKMLHRAKVLSKNGPLLDAHFLFQEIIQTYYSDRDDPEFMDIITEACQGQISLTPDTAKAFLAEGFHSLPSHVGYKQYAIILEKEKKFTETISLCKDAAHQGWAGDWDKRLERCKRKMGN